MVRRVQAEQKSAEVAANGPSGDGQAWTAGCLFSGMGGFATGLLGTGLRVSWATDNDPFAAATFRHRFPQIQFIEADITSLAVDAIDPVDILVGGFPCQSFSQAGTRDG
ncbi:MAG: DNA cytosine methyltransferase [Gammaproteobacteria bacterium]|nr:DNA cytosine methyltransferase [Gammaproteobacteria bacterium]